MSSYNKPYKSIDEHIELLKNRGLKITNEDFAKNLLKSLNYYNFSGYLYVFEKKEPNKRSHQFENTTFEEVYRFFNIDTQIRQLLFSCISYIEIYMRNVISRSFSDLYNNPFENYKLQNYKDINKVLIKEAKNSKERFIIHYKNKYNDDFPKPPIWISIEIMSLGTLSKFFASSENTLKSKIASYMNIHHHKYLNSWLGSISFIRNKCAHHSRLLCLPLKNIPIIPKKNNIQLASNYEWNILQKDSLFNFIVTLEYLVKKSEIYKTSTLFFINKIYQQLYKLSQYNLLKNKGFILNEIGIPQNWEGGEFFIN